ncbi:chaperone protein DnaJ-like isoform X1 [Telopea speciosissima]|uniref:chaperone protein DnaJ-like isoform X1 n=1 Tax=Telopea speciosissima TaxID=54955 RepID=UPI001CC3F446|nr:chaperone protein DnaJ-like isoform X1 [Telopea speciosissima]
MMWEDLYDEVVDEEETAEQDTYVDFDFFSELTKPKNYYKTLEVDFSATEDTIRSNYIRLALQWHPDKRKDEDSATSRFQEINEAYRVLSDPMRRKEYDKTCMLYDDDYNIIDYLNQYKSLILTCSGLGIRHSIWGSKESRHGEPL